MGEGIHQDPNQQDEPTHLGTVDHDDNSTGQFSTEEVPTDFIRNVEKAATMAEAQNAAFDAGERFPENASIRAGIEYDQNIARNRAKGYEPNEAEKEKSKQELDRYNLNKRNQILRYSNAIVEHNKEHGDQSSLSLTALAEVHTLVQDTGYTEFATGENHDYWGNENRVSVKLDQYGRVVVESGSVHSEAGKEEKFILSMFGGASYEVTEFHDDDKDFDQTFITRERTFRPEDVARLREVLAPAIAVRAEQKRAYDELDTHEELTDDAEDDDVHVSTGEIHRRASASLGDTEQARIATEMTPGDFK